MEKGWSQKTILREIVSSATYRQSSDVSPALLRARSRQPAARARRALPGRGRDGARRGARGRGPAAASKLGGPSVYPQQPEGVWNVPYSDMKWETSPGEDLHRRSLYTFYRRSSPYPSLVTFDAPSREQCTVRRVRTDTPLQALTTLNDPVLRRGGARARAAHGARGRDAHGRADRLRAPAVHGAAARGGGPRRARRVLRPREQARFAGDAAAARVRRRPAARRCPGAPLPESPAEAAALTMVANVLLNLDATITRE